MLIIDYLGLSWTLLDYIDDGQTDVLVQKVAIASEKSEFQINVWCCFYFVELDILIPCLVCETSEEVEKIE